MRKSDVINHFKKRVNIAEALGISSGSISQWGDVIPEKQALRLEHLTNGKLKYDSSLYTKAA
ncbi:Cro/CI family transcriptional regulator [Photobacterium alginatilyticum]|uniref:Cro/Cl family transcriptional regulator n=1 Tax=Photobacterium alginatilyticum TaxID=1775171 RepID=A0ABW9YMB5_9GAMM|nr:Cro/CI family transcriptional regulator [Photobacterium alginatilyticum]NBI54677.1 hypothetical protein [Photobacterium alginatilyticum]